MQLEIKCSRYFLSICVWAVYELRVVNWVGQNSCVLGSLYSAFKIYN